MLYHRAGGRFSLSAGSLQGPPDERGRLVEAAVARYSTGVLPMRALADLLGCHPFEAASHMTSAGTPGIRCRIDGDGTSADLPEVGAGEVVVADWTALFAVLRLGLDSVEGIWAGRRFAVTQGTLDRLRDAQDAEERAGNRDFIAADGRGGYIRAEADEQAREHRLQELRRVLDFVVGRFEVARPVEVASLDVARRGELDRLYGRDGTESLTVAARRPGHRLWTDDATVAVGYRDIFARTDRVQTYFLVRAAANAGTLSVAEADRIGARLVGLGYDIAPVTPGVVECSADLAGWDTGAWPLDRVLARMAAEPNPAARAEAAGRLIVAMYRQAALPLRLPAFVRAVLGHHRVTGDRVRIAQAVERLFGVDLLAAVEVLDVMRLCEWTAVWTPT